MKKIFLTLIGFIALAPFAVQAYMPATYPIYGYNSQEHICQVKQGSENSEVKEELDGEYWNIRECRWNNPEILFYTGLGIILWVLLFTAILLKHFYIAPRFLKEKSDFLKKKVGTVWDLSIVFSAVFIMILFLHYFHVPFATYNYSSDIDHIIYSVLIDTQIPALYLALFLIISFVTLYRKKSR